MRPYYDDGFLRTDAFSKNDAGIIIPVNSLNDLNEEQKEILEKNKHRLNSGVPMSEIVEKEGLKR
ncbi:MAG: hypothetical protein E7564_10900 [Ruminococcaceae bacterium]|nr:hypothetical protein [Oscillospiraceae bacterium]